LLEQEHKAHADEARRFPSLRFDCWPGDRMSETRVVTGILETEHERLVEIESPIAYVMLVGRREPSDAVRRRTVCAIIYHPQLRRRHRRPVCNGPGRTGTIRDTIERHNQLV